MPRKALGLARAALRFAPEANDERGRASTTPTRGTAARGSWRPKFQCRERGTLNHRVCKVEEVSWLLGTTAFAQPTDNTLLIVHVQLARARLLSRLTWLAYARQRHRLLDYPMQWRVQNGTIRGA